jgi:hypothetical protein
VVLTTVIRSAKSLESYGENKALLIRPDMTIFVIETTLGYLITYNLVIDHSRVYVGNIGKGSLDTTPLGDIAPGEASGARDAMLKFRMVIKVDAGIEHVIASENELVISTEKPPAIQSIRWAPEKDQEQTTTKLLGKFSWLSKKSYIVEMMHDRPMGLTVWIMNDGSAYAVHKSDGLKGFCFHQPEDEGGAAVTVAINARFSLIAIGCANGETKVYTARDYSGNIPLTLKLSSIATSGETGKISMLSYSPDGYCLFIGYEKGWSMWSVYGKAGANSFSEKATETWLAGIKRASWIGGGGGLLMLGYDQDEIWVLDIARNAATTCFSAANLSRPLVLSDSAINVYRGYESTDLSSMPADSSLWETVEAPASYIARQWPIRCATTSADGRYVAIAGRRGLAHYSVTSGRWKVDDGGDVFYVRGGLVWFQHLLIAAVDTGDRFEVS